MPTKYYREYRAVTGLYGINKKCEIKMIDSPGYGSHCDNKEWLNETINFINIRNEQFNVLDGTDNRIHLCLYFTTSVKGFDIEVMKSLSAIVNVIPIIGKVDSLTKKEAVDLKLEITNQEIGFMDLNNSLMVNLFYYFRM